MATACGAARPAQVSRFAETDSRRPMPLMVIGRVRLMASSDLVMRCRFRLMVRADRDCW